MLTNSQTAVLEKNTVLSGEFATEPFEVAWAREARWFFQALDGPPNATVTMRTQVSPDGLHWVDADDQDVTASAPLVTWTSSDFGHWLRIRGTVSEGANVKVRVYLALKG